MPVERSAGKKNHGAKVKLLPRSLEPYQSNHDIQISWSSVVVATIPQPPHTLPFLCCSPLRIHIYPSPNYCPTKVYTSSPGRIVAFQATRPSILKLLPPANTAPVLSHFHNMVTRMSTLPITALISKTSRFFSITSTESTKAKASLFHPTPTRIGYIEKRTNTTNISTLLSENVDECKNG